LYEQQLGDRYFTLNYKHDSKMCDRRKQANTKLEDGT